MEVWENYPNEWQGTVPEEMFKLLSGELGLNPSIYGNLEYIQHLVFPVFKPFKDLKVLDAACGTGEPIISQAIKYREASFYACDPSSFAREQLRFYIEQLGITNLQVCDELPDEQFPIVIHSRPLQHINDPTSWLENLSRVIEEDGVLILSSYTGTEPAKNLYLQEKVQLLKAGELTFDQAKELIDELMVLRDYTTIDTWPGFCKLVEQAGLHLYSGFHHLNYQPGQYLPELSYAEELLAPFNTIEKGYLAEQLNGSFLLHSIMCGRGKQAEMPKITDQMVRNYIPHRSPYAVVIPQEDRYQVGLAHRPLTLQPGVVFEDLNIPADLYRILPEMDGKRNMEQLYRRFLPMPWERFWALMEALVEVEIAYLHLPR